MEVYFGVIKSQELCESRGGRPGLPVANSPYGLCGRKATLEEEVHSSELRSCVEVEVGRPGLSVHNSPYGHSELKATSNIWCNIEYL